MNEKNLVAGGKVGTLTPVKAKKMAMRGYIVDSYLLGKSVRQIKDILKGEHGVKFAPNLITKIINEAVKEWEANKTDQIGQHKARELEKINRLECEYTKAWERSCQEAVTETEEMTRTKVGKQGERRPKMAVTKLAKTKKQNVGDSKFLDGIQWCIEMRCKILGLEAPVQMVQNTTVTVVRRTNFVLRKPPVEIEIDAITAN